MKKYLYAKRKGSFYSFTNQSQGKMNIEIPNNPAKTLN